MNFDYSFYYNDLLNFIKNRQPFNPDVVIILGSGLGSFANSVKKIVSINTSEIPGYPLSTVAGHNGFLHFAEIGTKKLLLFEGRIHFYEGQNIESTLLPIFISKELFTCDSVRFKVYLSSKLSG